jgi:hypothetical protein
VAPFLLEHHWPLWASAGVVRATTPTVNATGAARATTPTVNAIEVAARTNFRIRAWANCAFELGIIASFVGYRHDARPDCTTISGDYLVGEEEIPLPQMRKELPGFELTTAAETGIRRYLFRVFANLHARCRHDPTCVI